MSKNNSGAPVSSHNVVASGTKLVGQILSEEDFRIDGTVEGNIDCKGKIIIGPTSVVKGDVVCQNLELMGKIIGNVTCYDTIVFRHMCQLIGDIKTEIIEIEPGAKFIGACSMKSEPIENKK